MAEDKQDLGLYLIGLIIDIYSHLNYLITQDFGTVTNPYKKLIHRTKANVLNLQSVLNLPKLYM